jgi:Ca2+-binding RTX toxin-like protein
MVMANVNGTAGNDFIHVAGDGLSPPGGYTENAGATDFSDVITSGGGGDDIIYAGGGDDDINFGGDLTALDSIFGGAGADRLIINDETSIIFSATSMTGIDEILLPFISLPPDIAGFMELTMDDANLAASDEMRINAGGIGEDTFFFFDGSAETDGSFAITGGEGDDTLIGGQDGNFFDLTQGGDDTVTQGDGNDSLVFDDTFTAADRVTVRGGDTVNLGGVSYAIT